MGCGHISGRTEGKRKEPPDGREQALRGWHSLVPGEQQGSGLEICNHSSIWPINPYVNGWGHSPYNRLAFLSHLPLGLNQTLLEAGHVLFLPVLRSSQSQQSWACANPTWQGVGVSSVPLCSGQ